MTSQMHVVDATTGALIQAEEQHLAHNYHPLPVVIASGEGAWLTDGNGHQLLDAFARRGRIAVADPEIAADLFLSLVLINGAFKFWINLQSHYELDRAEDLAGGQIAAITPLSVA